MADMPTRDELFARARAAALAVPGVKISQREIDRPGSDANLIFAAMATLGEEVVNRMMRALAGCFEDTAHGRRRDRVIFDRKSLPRKGAEAAVVEVVLSRATALAGAGTVVGGLPGSTPQPTRIRTNSGIVYTILSNVSFAVGDLGPHTAPAQAELAGIDYEVDLEQGWSFVDPPFDTTIAVSNPDAAAGAAEEEDDDRYLSRSRNFYSTVQRGTKAAIDFGLQSVPGVDVENSAEVLSVASGLPAGFVQAYVLDRLGRANTTLAARAALVLNQYRALGVPVLIAPATPQFVDIETAIAFDTKVVEDTDAAKRRVQAAIVAALDNQRPGERLYRTTILAAARSIPGAVLEDTDLTIPAATLLPSTPSVAFRTRLELVRFRV